MLNHIVIHGRLTRDPELKHTQSDIACCSLSVAVDRSYAKKGEEKQTDFFNVTCWRGLAETVSKFFAKGQEIIVSGSMQCHSYTDKEGNKRTAWDLMADSVDFCGSKKDRDGGGYSPALGYDAPTMGDGFTELEDDGDLPF